MNDVIKKIPIWFWIVAGIGLLWNLMGINAFFQHINISSEALEAMPANEQELYTNYPIWVKIAFGIAVLGGVLGCIGLLVRKKWAKTLLLLSFIGVVVQMIYNLFISKAMDVYGPGSIAMPIMILVFSLLLLWFANHSIKKDWLK